MGYIPSNYLIDNFSKKIIIRYENVSHRLVYIVTPFNFSEIKRSLAFVTQSHHENLTFSHLSTSDEPKQKNLNLCYSDSFNNVGLFIYIVQYSCKRYVSISGIDGTGKRRDS